MSLVTDSTSFAAMDEALDAAGLQEVPGSWRFSVVIQRTHANIWSRIHRPDGPAVMYLDHTHEEGPTWWAHGLYDFEVFGELEEVAAALVHRAWEIVRAEPPSRRAHQEPVKRKRHRWGPPKLDKGHPRQVCQACGLVKWTIARGYGTTPVASYMDAKGRSRRGAGSCGPAPAGLLTSHRLRSPRDS